jgi:hypothetical protein
MCGYSRHFRVSATSDEDFGAWLDHHVWMRWSLPMTPTDTRDPIRVDFSPSDNFVGHVGGGGGARVIYDSRHQLLALSQVFDTAAGFFLEEDVPPPQFPVARGDLATFETARGIRLGSTDADVKRVYGPASIVHFGDSRYRLSYQRFVPVSGPRTPPTFSPFGVYTWFNIVNGRVASIGRLTGF